MNLKKSIVILTVIAVFIILMAVFALVSFPVAGTVYDYHGYATTIKLGLDLSGGVSAVFNVEDDGSEGDLAARVDGTVLSLQEMAQGTGELKGAEGGATLRAIYPFLDDTGERELLGDGCTLPALMAWAKGAMVPEPGVPGSPRPTNGSADSSGRGRR